MHLLPFLLTPVLMGSFETPPPPPPPAALKTWVEYAHALNDDPGCPPNLPCVHFSRVAFVGKPATGAMMLKISGQNLGRRLAEAPLLGPASDISVVKAHFTAGKGVAHLDDDNAEWVVAAHPGAFAVDAEVRFEPEDSLSVELASPVAAVVDALEQGSLIFDDTSAQHGGTVFVQSGKREAAAREDVTMRIDRSIVYGGTTTFTYRFAVAGLREQTRMALPLLGDEAIETVSPDTPYSVEKGEPDTLAVTLTPAAPIVTVTGHFNGAVTQLRKPPTNPFEYWMFTSDARHPVDVACDGVEIDAREIRGLIATPSSRAFMVSEDNSLRITPVAVNVDKGRQGSGNARLSYVQNAADTWMSDLTIVLQTAPGVDRMVMTSSNAAHYAAVGGNPVRMFNADAQKPEALSLRVTDALAPMRVQWREAVATNAWLSLPSLRLPAQTVHLDEATAQVLLRPGFVPLSVWGVQNSHGDLWDGITLYAVLLALLGCTLARQARLPVWALVATGILLAGLYTVDAFPHLKILTLLAGTLVIVRLPDMVLQRVGTKRWVHRIVMATWAGLCLVTVLDAFAYAQDRVFSALHPWAQTETADSSLNVSSATTAVARLDEGGGRPRKGAATEREVEEDEAEAQPAPPPMPSPQAGAQPFAAQRRNVKRELAKKDAGLEHVNRMKKMPSAPLLHQVPESATLSSRAGGRQQKPAKAVTGIREKTVLPVAFAPPDLPATLFTYGFGALPLGEDATARVLLVGPCLRGLWMLTECAALASLLALLLLRSKRLWFVPSASEVAR